MSTTIAIALTEARIASLSGRPGGSHTGGFLGASVEVAVLETANNLIVETRAIRALIQLLDRRKADQSEGDV